MALKYFHSIEMGFLPDDDDTTATASASASVAPWTFGLSDVRLHSFSIFPLFLTSLIIYSMFKI